MKGTYVQVSCSYGPGRYDPNYEEKGQDYPLGFVRWTEQRNFEAILDMLACGQLDVQALITHRFAFEDAPQAYQALVDDKEKAGLGILLQYTADAASRAIRQLELRQGVTFDPVRPVLGFIGAGNYASRMLIPAFKAAGAQFHTIATAGGINGVIHGQKAGLPKHRPTSMRCWPTRRSILSLSLPVTTVMLVSFPRFFGPARVSSWKSR